MGVNFVIWVFELVFVAGMLLIGHLRKRGLWFLFGLVVGSYSLFELSANALVVTFLVTPSCVWDNQALIAVCSPSTYDVQLSPFMYFIPLILIIVNAASIISLRRQIGRGAV